jgi:hypothetical protein
VTGGNTDHYTNSDYLVKMIVFRHYTNCWYKLRLIRPIGFSPHMRIDRHDEVHTNRPDNDNTKPVLFHWCNTIQFGTSIRTYRNGAVSVSPVQTCVVTRARQIHSVVAAYFGGVKESNGIEKQKNARSPILGGRSTICLFSFSWAPCLFWFFDLSFPVLG